MNITLQGLLENQVTFDETPPRPFHLRRDDHSCGNCTRPHYARPRFHREDTAARNVGRLRRGQHHNVVIEVAVESLVVDLAFCLLWANAVVQRLDIRHVPRQQLRAVARWGPVRYLHV